VRACWPCSPTNRAVETLGAVETGHS
jgi:hypothetical protein